MTTVRTIKLKRNPQTLQEPASASSESDASAPSDQAPAPAAQPAAVASAAPVAAAGSQVSAKSYLPYVIAASVVALFFLIIMGLQYSEMSLYQAEPSVWVKK